MGAGAVAGSSVRRGSLADFVEERAHRIGVGDRPRAGARWDPGFASQEGGRCRAGAVGGAANKCGAKGQALSSPALWACR
jgi:hypothetical protein